MGWLCQPSRYKGYRYQASIRQGTKLAGLITISSNVRQAYVLPSIPPGKAEASVALPVRFELNTAFSQAHSYLYDVSPPCCMAAVAHTVTTADSLATSCQAASLRASIESNNRAAAYVERRQQRIRTPQLTAVRPHLAWQLAHITYDTILALTDTIASWSTALRVSHSSPTISGLCFVPTFTTEANSVTGIGAYVTMHNRDHMPAFVALKTGLLEFAAPEPPVLMALCKRAEGGTALDRSVLDTMLHLVFPAYSNGRRIDVVTYFIAMQQLPLYWDRFGTGPPPQTGPTPHVCHKLVLESSLPALFPALTRDERDQLATNLQVITANSLVLRVFVETAALIMLMTPVRHTFQIIKSTQAVKPGDSAAARRNPDRARELDIQVAAIGRLLLAWTGVMVTSRRVPETSLTWRHSHVHPLMAYFASQPDIIKAENNALGLLLSEHPVDQVQADGQCSPAAYSRIAAYIASMLGVNADNPVWRVASYPGLQIGWPTYCATSYGPGGHITYQRPPLMPHVVAWPSMKSTLMPAMAKMFPVSHVEDGKHLTLRYGALLTTYDPEHRARVAKGLPPDQLETIMHDQTAFNAHRRKWTTITRCLPVGTNQVRVICLWASLFSSTADAILNLIARPGMLYGPQAVVNARLAAQSVLLRRCGYQTGRGHVGPTEVAQLAYMELSCGRAMNITDWQQEVSNRSTATEPLVVASDPCINVWYGENDLPARRGEQEASQYLQLLKTEVINIMRQLIGKSYVVKESLSEFYARRHEWVTSGSASGTTLGSLMEAQNMGATLKKHPELRPMRVNKRVWADLTPYSTIDRALTRDRPTERASASEKYENGKARALYGVEPVHYVLNTYSTLGLESRVKRVSGCEKGEAAFGIFLNGTRRSNITADPAFECTMFDYADFNRQHTPAAQALIFNVLADMGEANGCHPDWVAANRWVARAKYNMQYTLPNDRKLRHAKQGMFSGTRSTDFINTILNLAYYQVAARQVEASHGSRPDSLYHVHQGDDVWISNKNQLWPRLVYYQLNHAGLIFQEKKQMFGPHYGEYLRVLYAEGAAVGYLQRALVNYTLRPLQNDEVDDLASLATMFTSSINLLGLRGMTTAGQRALWCDATHHWLVMRDPHVAKARKPVRPPIDALILHPLLGGLGFSLPGHTTSTTSHLATCLPTPPANTSSLAPQLAAVRSPMTEDWLRDAGSKLQANSMSPIIRTEAVVETAKQANYHNVNKKLSGRSSAAAYRGRLAQWADASRQLLASADMKSVPDADMGVVIRSWQDMIPALPSQPTPCWPSSAAQLRACCPAVGSTHFKLPRRDPTSKLSSHISSFEAGSIFKSVDATAQALGVSRREAVRMMAEVDASVTLATEDVVLLLRHRVSTSTHRHFEYVLGRQVGFVSQLAAHMSGSFLDLLHASIVEAVIKNEWAAKHRTESAVAATDMAMAWATCTYMGTYLKQASKAAF